MGTWVVNGCREFNFPYYLILPPPVWKAGIYGEYDHRYLSSYLIQVLLAGAVLMRFVEEIKNAHTTKRLAEKVEAKIQVLRDGKTREVRISHPGRQNHPEVFSFQDCKMGSGVQDRMPLCKVAVEPCLRKVLYKMMLWSGYVDCTGSFRRFILCFTEHC